MNRKVYRKLAFNNVKKNKNTFMPFSLSSISMIAMFYMLNSIQMQADENLFFGANTMQMILQFGVIICGIFSLFVVFYTNSFLMKRRSKEFGLYSILGMEKKHIAKVVLWEIAIVGIGSIAGGMFAGALFSKLMFMVLLKLLHLKTDFTFQILAESIILTAVLFTAVFVLIMVVNTVRVYRLKPMELMWSERAGEREPKAKWLLALLGIILLGAGYYLALTTKNPIQAMSVFFVAVLLVIAGTYLLFISGSIALLKMLKRNKNYYYQKNHFITVSGMMYRMKQNAAGLANICILSTAVLVVLSSTVSLYIGMDNVLRTRYPKDVITNYLYEEGMESDDSSGHYDYSVLETALKMYAEEKHVNMKDIEHYYSYSTVGTLDGNSYVADYLNIDTMTVLEIATLEDYNAMTGESQSLEKGEVLVWLSEDKQFNKDTIRIINTEYPIKKIMDKIPFTEAFNSSYGKVFLVVHDLQTMQEICGEINDTVEDGGYSNINYNYNFDLEGGYKDKAAFCKNLRDIINDTGIAHTATVENIYTVRQEFYGIYGSLFFIGIFMGAMFLITTVMIIYYKQISEGYDDRERFIIMQKVGMSKGEVKSVIKSQILLVFFLPILLAVIHICFAFDIIKKLLIMLNLTNITLFIICTIGTVAVFFIIYGIVYSLTAKAYYHITNQ